MGITFDDGEFFDTTDINRMKRLILEKARGGKANAKQIKPTEIKSKDGVTIKVGNLRLNPKMPLANPNYISAEYRGWTIRVWRQEQEGIFGCNYFSGEDVRYFEANYQQVADENRVIRIVQNYIDEILEG